MEHQKISALIKEAIRVLCQNGLTYNEGFAVEGVLQVITDTKQAFQIDVNEMMGLNADDVTVLKQEMGVPDQQTIKPFNMIKTGTLLFIYPGPDLCIIYLLPIISK